MLLTPSEFYTLDLGEERVVVDRRSGALVQFSRYGVDFCPGRGEQARRASYQGSILLPFVNRIADGRYRFDGRIHQLSVNEPRTATALHGLADRAVWNATYLSSTECLLSLPIRPFPGYPFCVDVSARYLLDPLGLRIDWHAVNVGGEPVPLGLGFHPSLRLPNGSPKDWLIKFGAEQRMSVDSSRLLPTGLVPVDASPYDFRSGAYSQDAFYDHAYTGLPVEQTENGFAHRAWLSDREGNLVKMSWSTSLPWVHLHIPLVQPEGLENVVLEPQTSPPDAFNSGVGLVVLQPGESFQAWCRISVSTSRDSAATEGS